MIASGASSEAGGVPGTVHSFRYFDGNLQVLVTTVNSSADEAELSFGDCVTAGRQYTNIFSNTIRPGVTNTAVAEFEAVPPGKGVLYGNIWIGSSSELEVELPVPAIGQ